MKQDTRTQQAVQALLNQGETEVVPSRSAKYRQFTRTSQGDFYWVGRCGAVRAGKSPSSSRSVTYKFQEDYKGYFPR
ncbi:hypothetical protein JT06_18560 [Desulfobulbus sp. Tol-SR]|nr:hypothetical protein JT06_18560 [Desulfobulbus sp. Tol-SR]